MRPATTSVMQVPVLWPSAATPPAEIQAVKDLYGFLMGLVFRVEAWEAALLLLKTARNPPPTIPSAVAKRWRFVACNEAVLELYHLRAMLEKTQSVKLRACPSLRPSINFDGLKSARKRLDEFFPDIEALRHATAHGGENDAYPEVHAPDGGFALSGFRSEDVYSMPYQGKLRYIEMSDESLRRINAVVSEFLLAFEPAAAALAAQGHID